MTTARFALPILFVALAATATFTPAQTLDVGTGVDLTTKTTALEFKVVGSPGATVALFAAFKLTPTPIALSIGKLHLDPATLVALGTFPLNASGVGSLGFKLPSASFRTYAFAVQAVMVSGASVSLSPYALTGGWANSTGTEILVATYHPGPDQFYLLGKGPSGALLELFRKPPLGTRLRLGGITVPYASMAWGVKPCVFTPGDVFSVYAFGTMEILRLE